MRESFANCERFSRGVRLRSRSHGNTPPSSRTPIPTPAMRSSRRKRSPRPCRSVALKASYSPTIAGWKSMRSREGPGSIRRAMVERISDGRSAAPHCSRSCAACRPTADSARFVCALALIEPGREPIAVTGHVNGYLLEVESGTGGFGYDPLFFYPPSGRSFASLSEKEKNAVSHRRRAADALLAALRSRV